MKKTNNLSSSNRSLSRALQAVLLVTLVSTIGLSFSFALAAWIALAMGAALAFFIAFRLTDAAERRAGFALTALVTALAAFFVFFASLDAATRSASLLFVPLFLVFFLAFFLLVRKNFFSAPASARVLSAGGGWAVVRVERSLASDAAPGVYAARIEKNSEKKKKVRVGSVVRVRFAVRGPLAFAGVGEKEALVV